MFDRELSALKQWALQNPTLFHGIEVVVAGVVLWIVFKMVRSIFRPKDVIALHLR